MDADFGEIVEMFKLLADASRLRILGSLAEQPRSVEELAAFLGVRPPTVSHHLGKLHRAGLVAMAVDGTSHIYRLEVEGLRRLQRLLPTPESVRELATPQAEDRWQRKVLSDFFVGERLKEIPASRKKRLVILRFLADRFAWDRRYREAEVNETIACHHPDFATLRRELVMARFLAREGGYYWRIGAQGGTEPHPSV